MTVLYTDMAFDSTTNRLKRTGRIYPPTHEQSHQELCHHAIQHGVTSRIWLIQRPNRFNVMVRRYYVEVETDRLGSDEAAFWGREFLEQDNETMAQTYERAERWCQVVRDAIVHAVQELEESER